MRACEDRFSFKGKTVQEIEEVEDEDFERPETPHEMILGRVQQMVRERPEDAAKLVRTMLMDEAN